MRRNIQEMDNMDIRDMGDVNKLKKTTISYYKAMLRLKELDILEAQLMAVTLQNDTGKARKAGMDISNLIHKRLKLHKVISESDQARQSAKAKFMQVNYLR